MGWPLVRFRGLVCLAAALLLTSGCSAPAAKGSPRQVADALVDAIERGDGDAALALCDEPTDVDARMIRAYAGLCRLHRRLSDAGFTRVLPFGRDRGSGSPAESLRLQWAGSLPVAETIEGDRASVGYKDVGGQPLPPRVELRRTSRGWRVRRYAPYIEGPDLDPEQHLEAAERARIWESVLHVLRPVVDKAVSGKFQSAFDVRVAVRRQLATTRMQRQKPSTQPAVDPAAVDVACDFLFAIALGEREVIRRLYVGDDASRDALLATAAYEDVRRRIDSAASARFKNDETLFFDVESLQLLGQISTALVPANGCDGSLVLRNPWETNEAVLRLQKRSDGWKVIAVGSDEGGRDLDALAKRTVSLEKVLTDLSAGKFSHLMDLAKAINAADPKARPRQLRGEIGDS